MDFSSNQEKTALEPAFSAVSDDETIKLLKSINERLGEMTKLLDDNEALAYYKKVHNPHRLFWRNFGIGIARGLGMTVGLTLVATLLVFLLKPIISLPVIGDYIAEIVRVVQSELVTLP